MNITLAFIRLFFVLLSVFFLTVYKISGPEGATSENWTWGIVSGAVFGAVLIGFEVLFRRFNLRAFNIALVGLFIGYLMGQALVLILSSILDISAASIHLSASSVEILEICLFLFGIYLGTLITLRAADEFYISIPFVRFAPSAHKKKDLLVESSILADARILDLASSGILDQQLIIPRFIVKDLYAQAEVTDEGIRAKAKKSLEVLKKLETVPHLQLRYNETDFPEVKDSMNKLLRLARLIDANLLTADITRVQMSSIEGIRAINLHSLSNALKPLMQTGENIRIKIQRYGKEPRQGVGYLEDGTMVVVNGGGQFIGEVIEAQVLSVKHTSSGRMIFCNAMGEEDHPPQHTQHDE